MQYYSFEKVLKELQMEEDELKRLVSEGEIRAFRDEDKMKFKKSDIDGLKKGRMTEPTIILPSGEPDDSAEDSEVLLVEEDTSETLLDIDDLDSAESSSTSVPTVDFSSSDFEDSSASETITEELTFEEDSGSYVLESSDDVLIDSSGELTELDASSEELQTEELGSAFMDSDTGLQTEPLEVNPDIEAADLDSSYGSSDDGLVDLDSGEHETEGITQSRGRSTRIIQTSVAPEPLHPALTATLVASTLAMLFTGALMLNTLREVDTPITYWWSDLMYQLFPTSQHSQSKIPKPREIENHLDWRSKTREGKKSNYGPKLGK